ncbi:MAG: hypothetical protein P8Y34_10205, partial [Anaerolineales bacterium]
QLMVGTGFVLLGIGLVMLFLPPGVGDNGPFVIEFFQASIEASEMGLALIVLGLSCFLIGRKDLADLRTTRGIQQDLQQTSRLAAGLVAERVDQTVKDLPVQAAHLGTLPDLDLEGTLGEMTEIQEGGMDGQDLSQLLERAQRGLSLLQALKKQDQAV